MVWILFAAMMGLLSLQCRADDAAGGSLPTAASVAAETLDASLSRQAPDAEGPRVRRHAPARHLSVSQSIDETVRKLTRGLDLDSGQQEKLRQILVDQHQQITALRSGSAPAPTDMAGTMLAIYNQTKARIRSMLNDMQKKQYSVDVPRDDLAPAQADLQHWMDLQESKRRQDLDEEKSK